MLSSPWHLLEATGRTASYFRRRCTRCLSPEGSRGRCSVLQCSVFGQPPALSTEWRAAQAVAAVYGFSLVLAVCFWCRVFFSGQQHLR